MNPELVNKNHVLQAITEYDRLGRDDFLKKYGFGKSRQYLLLHKEKTYDSKPIFGVAHGFATGDFLTAKDFSGGVAAAAGYLQNIGFEISKERSNTITPSAPSHTRNQKWSREEVILVLDVYMRHGLIGEKHPELQNLSNTLRKRVDLTKVASPDKYRNLNGCKMKLANLASLDPGYEGVGLKGGGQLEEEIWNEFAGDQERLSILAAQLRSYRNTYSKLADDDRLGKSAIKDSYSPNYWWVNQNQTFKEEFTGG